MHWLVCPCVEINVHSYFDKNCWFRRDGVGPDKARRVAVSGLGGHFFAASPYRV